jgi:radical SAM enzyme (TIGR01210 family)
VASGADGRIRDLRPERVDVDPWVTPDFLLERERSPDDGIATVLTIFLIGRECPFTCVFCDLWRSTTEQPTPVGALPQQIRAAMVAAAASADAVKLYNASNFFDPRAVPDADIEAVTAAVVGFERITVESHPLLIGERCRQFAERLEGDLEVAMGLETIHPDVLPRLNKQMTLGDFERAADQLGSWGVGARAFVLVGVPFLHQDDQVEWALRSVEQAAAWGVRRVSLIPVRGDNGEMERLKANGDWESPTLDQLELALESTLAVEDVMVTADTWDLDRFSRCEVCLSHRIERITEINLLGSTVPRRSCDACGWT